MPYKSRAFSRLLRNKGHEKSGVPVLPVLEVRNAALAVRYEIFQSVIGQFSCDVLYWSYPQQL